ncbi:MAG TPA: peptidase [Thermoanaerobaculia bacterium]|nr:peptidase [Thermoanaerobaculia bacterium]
MSTLHRFTALPLLLLLSSCVTATPPTAATTATPMTSADSTLAIAPDIAARLRQLPDTPIDYDRSLLDENERQVVAKLIEASRDIDAIFLRQVSEENPALLRQLTVAAKDSPPHRDALRLFHVMKGRWDRLKKDEPFIAPLGAEGAKPEGGGFYPADATKEELERWLSAHPEEKAKFEDLFTVVRRSGDGFVTIPYSVHYRENLESAAQKLREAAGLTRNASLKDFLNKRATAFLTDDYFASDVAWMDLDSPIEVVIGPYEVYEDGLFNLKAAYESFITVVDKPESEKLAVYAGHLADMERNLPMPDIHKNPNRGSESPIRVVQEIYTSGDARRGVQTAAFNLPNDERVREAKGSKKVLLKNVMEAKYRKNGRPIAERLLDKELLPLLSFDAFFNHVLFHELSHGLGPGFITGPDGKKVEARILLKNLYSTIEESKADVLGVWNLFYAMDKKLLTGFNERQLLATNTGLMFRSMRFGIDEAHGRGTAIQWNWYRERGAIIPADGGRFTVVFGKMRGAVESLANELLLIEATGDFARAQRLVDTYGKTSAEMDRVIASLTDIPVDIWPVFVAAGER